MTGKAVYSFIIVGLFLFLGFGIVLGAPSGAKTASWSEYRQLRQGYDAYQSGEYESALSAYSEALSRPAFERDIKSNIGTVFYAQGQYQNAVEAYQDALESPVGDEPESVIDQKTADLYYNMGNAYVQLNQKQAAIDAYKKALDAAPNDRDIKYNLEVAYHLPDPPKDPNQPNPKPDPKTGTPPPPPQQSPPPPNLDETKLNAQQMLNLLEQLEKQARKRYRTQPPEPEFIEFDW